MRNHDEAGHLVAKSPQPAWLAATAPRTLNPKIVVKIYRAAPPSFLSYALLSRGDVGLQLLHHFGELGLGRAIALRH